jgi:hypothetical protein
MDSPDNLNNATVTFQPWTDPLLDRLGQHPDLPYGRLGWLPVIGPATYLLWANLATELRQVDTVTWVLNELATSLGLGVRDGRNSPIHKTLVRAEHFRILHPLHVDETGESTYLLRLNTPPLARRQLDRAPRHVTDLHEQLWRPTTSTSCGGAR